MKTLNAFSQLVVLVSLPLLLGGCGEKVVNDDEIEYRDGVAYLKGSNWSYTGKVIGLNSKGEKRSESQLKKGKMKQFLAEAQKAAGGLNRTTPSDD